MKRNIGVAIAIPRPFADELEGWRDRFGDPAAHLIQAHVTLLPPTTVADVAAVEQHLAGVAERHGAFPIVLAGTGTFRPLSPVVYVRVASGGEQVGTLEADVRSGPLARSLRFPYHPHVTIAHSVDEGAMDRAMRELAGFRADVPMTAMSLHERRDDHWSLVQQFDFTGASTG